MHKVVRCYDGQGPCKKCHCNECETTRFQSMRLSLYFDLNGVNFIWPQIQLNVRVSFESKASGSDNSG